MFFSGSDGPYNILIMELLGPSVEDIFNKLNQKLSLKSLLMLGEQMFNCVEQLHGK